MGEVHDLIRDLGQEVLGLPHDFDLISQDVGNCL